MKAGLALGFTVVLWASAFPVVRFALGHFEPAELAAYRFAAASAALAAYAIVVGLRRPARPSIPWLVGLGAVGITAYHLAFNTGARQLSAGTASFLINTVPVFTAILARVVLKERVGTQGTIGIVVSFLGVAIIATAESGRPFLVVGGSAGLVLLAAVCQSVYFIGQKRLVRDITPVELTAFSVWAGTLILLPLLPGALSSAVSASVSANVAVLYLGIVPAALGYIAYAYVLRTIPVSRATSALFAVPPIAMIMAWLMLGEIPRFRALVGGFVALTGVALVAHRPRTVPTQ